MKDQRHAGDAEGASPRAVYYSVLKRQAEAGAFALAAQLDELEDRSSDEARRLFDLLNRYREMIAEADAALAASEDETSLKTAR